MSKFPVPCNAKSFRAFRTWHVLQCSPCLHTCEEKLFNVTIGVRVHVAGIFSGGEATFKIRGVLLKPMLHSYNRNPDAFAA
eukprot:611857-Pelagomonas_calceolata.AAC.1